MFCKKILSHLREIDLFGKEPQLYYKGNEKKKTFIGTVFSFLFILIYIGFFIYKLLKLINKSSLSFYETSSYLEKPPSVKINKDNFYGGFALEHPITYDPIIDERIYYPKAYFKKQQRNGQNWEFDIKELELEPCKLENFGKKYQDKIVHNSLSSLYCPKKLEDTLMGHFSYDVYSYLYVEFFPCINSTENNNHCKPEEEIDFYLRNTFVCFEMEDVELTPKNYKKPVMERNQDIYFTVGKKLFQEVHVFYQIVNVETDLDIFGFEDIPNIKKQEYLKYHSTIQMTNLIENNIYKTGEAFSAITIKLFDFVKTQRRSYDKLINILGEIGGVMEIVFTLLQIVSSSITDIFYEISIVNNLFEFDISKRKIRVKNKTDKDTLNTESQKGMIKMPSYINFKRNNNRHNTATISENNGMIGTSENRVMKVKRRSTKKKIIFTFPSKNESINDANNKNKKDEIDLNKQKETTDDKSDKVESINKIKMNKAYVILSFCFIRKRKNVHNILLDEGMKIFSENMDIINVFKKSMELGEKSKENIEFGISESGQAKLLNVKKV